jgi:hypothetical protein
MSSVDYSTDLANYHQIYAVHTLPVEDKVFKKENLDSVDAIVLEMAHDENAWKMLWESEYKKHYDPIFQAIQGKDKPVYVVDVLSTPSGRSTDTMTNFFLNFLGIYGIFSGVNNISKQIKEKNEIPRRKFLTSIGIQSAKILAGTYLGSDIICRKYTTRTGDEPEFLARLNSSRTHLVPTSQIELRNAISARKIEEYVAPELQTKLGRKPNIVLVYGALHSGLKEDLQHKKLRNTYIDFYDAMNFPGIDATHINTITNASIDQTGKYSLQHRTSNLF